MKVATEIKSMTSPVGADQKLYKVDPPMQWENWREEKQETTEYVVVSGTVTFTGTETYIFPANEQGEILSFGELDGSFRGSIDHELALKYAGYMVK